MLSLGCTGSWAKIFSPDATYYNGAKALTLPTTDTDTNTNLFDDKFGASIVRQNRNIKYIIIV
jgi:hypothetical protein